MWMWVGRDFSRMGRILNRHRGRIINRHHYRQDRNEVADNHRHYLKKQNDRQTHTWINILTRSLLVVHDTNISLEPHREACLLEIDEY